MKRPHNKTIRLTTLAALIMLCGFLIGVDAFTYSNPLVKKGNLYYKNKKYKEALNSYLKAENDVPDKSAIAFNIANAYYKTNDFDNALKYFERSLRNDNVFNAKVMFNMGDCYFKSGELKKSYEKFKAALKLDPDNRDAKYNLEFVLSMMEQNKGRRDKKKSDKKKDARRREADRRDDKKNRANKNAKRDKEIAKDDYSSKINYDDDFKSRDDLDEISKSDALRILSTLTEQVIMRVPMKKEKLTKKGEHNEKDW